MSILNTSSTQRATVTAVFSNVLTALVAYIRQRRIYLTTVKELSRLSDRELRDLGIARHDIKRVSRQAAESA
ncbi:MAG: DUF1127 domain-containing protein [Rhodobacteraceae bacterium]|nr:DUF1127 domain-containing protein [Paracoccaceae bacterium]